MPEVLWMGKNIPLIPDNKQGIWFNFIGADLTTEPGRYKLEIKDSNHPQSLIMSVLSKDYGVRRLTLPENMVSLDAETLKRVRKESEQMKEVFSSSVQHPLWCGKWIRPVSGDIVGPFGRKSIINGMKRSPHSGVDFRAAEGTPVKAANRGKVVLADNHFFSGLKIVIDHGGGVYSMYFHLDYSFVQTDQLVEKGDIVGLSGSTGRATGPHLHFGIRLNGNRINPINLMEISERLEAK
jgi:murein DD-endopeptidase MepM/ murein hydrolase activator NlpD